MIVRRLLIVSQMLIVGSLLIVRRWLIVSPILIVMRLMKRHNFKISLKNVSIKRSSLIGTYATNMIHIKVSGLKIEGNICMPKGSSI